MATPKRFELDAVRRALLDQGHLIEQQLASRPDEVFAQPTRLGDWTVDVLVAHLALTLGSLAEWIGAPEPAGTQRSLSSYYEAARKSAGFVDSISRAAAAGKGPQALRAAYREALEGVSAALAGVHEGQLVTTRSGAMAATDLVVTRCIEVVVHGLDLQAATGVPALATDAVRPAALTVVVKAFGAILMGRAPGHSVEVRIPGPAGTAFQCGEGPQHTRGTPPNVVETDPVTFIELGAGRLDWATAIGTGAVRASGGRADLSALLPLVG